LTLHFHNTGSEPLPIKTQARQLCASAAATAAAAADARGYSEAAAAAALLRPLLLLRLLLLLRRCYGAPWWRPSCAHEVRLSRRSRALANPRARRDAQEGRGREHAHMLGKPRMPMAVPTPLPIAIEHRSGCHGREILRRDVEPASKLTCSLRYARQPDALSCSRPSSAAAAATCATSCAARSGRRARARPKRAAHAAGYRSGC
jgi:hypothetical protein